MTDVMIADNDIAMYPNGEAVLIDGTDAAVQQIKIALKVPRGAFAYDRELGIPSVSLTGDPDKAEELLNEALVNTPVYVRINSAAEQGNGVVLGLTVSDGFGSEQREVNI